MMLSKKIIELRKSREWTQSELASRSETTQSMIARFESGERLPTSESIRGIANAFQIPVEDLNALLDQDQQAEVELSELKKKFGMAMDLTSQRKKILMDFIDVLVNENDLMNTKENVKKALNKKTGSA